jgi:kinesin family protein 2/24
MGNSESANPIRNMDKRTARREYKDDFAGAITRYRQVHLANVKKESVSTIAKNIENGKWEDGNIRVFVRKRPIFQHELENGEFDVVTCIHNKVVIHDARMHNDMKKQLMNHHEFEFDYVFSDKASNNAVYTISTKPLVEIACKGGFSTALVYGQTGNTLSSFIFLALKG